MNAIAQPVADEAPIDQPPEAETNLLVLGEVSKVTEGGFWGVPPDGGNPLTFKT